MYFKARFGPFLMPVYGAPACSFKMFTAGQNAPAAPLFTVNGLFTVKKITCKRIQTLYSSGFIYRVFTVYSIFIIVPEKHIKWLGIYNDYIVI